MPFDAESKPAKIPNPKFPFPEGGGGLMLSPNFLKSKKNLVGVLMKNF